MPENGGNMYKPHRCFITVLTGGFDEYRNPIPSSSQTIEIDSCFLDQNLPNTPIFSQDGQKVKEASGVLFLNKDSIDLNLISVGNEISVFVKESDVLLFKGEIKSFSEDLFHIRLWV